MLIGFPGENRRARMSARSCFGPIEWKDGVAALGDSTVQVHGMFTIHGAEHEITIPVRVEMAPGRWTATSRSPFLT